MGFNSFGLGFENIWPTSLRVVFPWFSETSKSKSARGKNDSKDAKTTKKTHLNSTIMCF